MSQKIFPITMPKWGIEMQQGTITEWHAVPGGALAKGAPLLDVETEKIVLLVLETEVAALHERYLAAAARQASRVAGAPPATAE